VNNPLSKTSGLRLSGVSKSYGATQALVDVSLRIDAGRAEALVGENGAGKSTLVRILNGLTRPDAGSVEVAGRRLRLGSPGASAAAGIATVYQELSLVPEMTVAENLYLGPAQRTVGRLATQRRLRDRAAADLAEFGVHDIHPDWRVADLSLPERQRIEIVKAVRRRPRVLFLDEATSALGKDAIGWFYRLVEGLKAQGITLVFVTHRLEEVGEICEEVTVLRNGQVVGQHPVAELDRAEMIRLMIGRSLEVAFPPRSSAPRGAPALRVRGLRRPGALHDVSFDLHQGEIVGLAGLDGQGQLDLLLALFGVRPADGGEIHVDGRPVRIRRPADAIRAGLGIGFVPEDRKIDGVLRSQPVSLTMALPSLGRMTRLGWVSGRRRREAVRRAARLVELSEGVLEQPAETLSGGNQQKAVIGKWVVADSRVLLLYDPTRGVDVGAKLEIYRLLRELADSGVAILCYSSELPEVINLSDRVLVFYQRRVAAELSGAEQTEQNVLAAAIGHGGDAA
jgi:ribose transport system ATP-binding protein